MRCPLPSPRTTRCCCAYALPCDHISRRTALLLIGAPLVSGFASMAGCHDNENVFQALMSAMPPEEDLPPGVDNLGELTCSIVASVEDDFCSPNNLQMWDLVCAGSCQYHGPCTGDGALTVLFSDSMTCSTFSMIDEADIMAYIMADVDDGEVDSDAIPFIPVMYAFGRELCGLPPASRRARKMTDAPPVDASKVQKLAAAMLRSTKTMAHRLAQVAVSRPPRRTPPARLPARPRARPSPPEHTL